MTEVAFLDVTATSRWIAKRGAARIIAELTDALEQDFLRWPELETRPRLASHSPDGVIELMPAADSEQFAVKLVNGHPANPGRGFQTVSACGLLVDVHNGYPVFLAEMTLLTAIRTAAASALAARFLAPRPAKVMTLIGTGAQAEFQALGFREELGINQIRTYDVDPKAMAKFERNARDLGFEVAQCGSSGEAALGADVITTCTADKRFATVLFADEVAAGVHINAIGGDCPGKTELDPELLYRADLVVVEHEAQCRAEGEIQKLPSDFPVTELWRVVAGAAPGRRTPDELTIFDSVGFGVEDFTTLRYVRSAVAQWPELVQHLELIANPADPKDLYSLVAASG